jgi:stearoyl-CoA desaturase (delta-9 desaturase)
MPTTGPVSPKRPSDLPPDPDRVQWLKSLPFILVHLAALAAPLVAPLTWKWAGLVLATYAVRMFAITAGYHRYFSHRSYRTGRAFLFLLAALGASSAQKGPLWWAAHHRDHHRFSDGPRDVHSPVQRGFLWSHMGWILAARYDETPLDRVKDLARYPELRWLDRWHLVPTVLLAAGLFAWGGAPALFWGYFASTVLLWHCTFFINSLAHVLGRRRYETGAESRNSFLLALLTLGEGWHNNHHFYPSATNQGWFWWEIDVSYYLLRALSLVGLVRDLRTPPQRVREGRIGEGPEASAPADLDPLPG